MNEKIIVPILNHFRKNWWKWCLLLLCAGLALSGYSCDTKYIRFEKKAAEIGANK